MVECGRGTQRVVVCADASPQMGLGHVMRSIALAHELTALGCATTVCGLGVPADLIGSASLVVPPSTADAATVASLHPDLVVVDGYHFDERFFAALDECGIRYGVIDDNGDTPALGSVLVVNQNPHADPSMYDRMTAAPLLLLGTRFALLRTEIRELTRRAPVRRPGTVFVAFGGSDPRGLTLPVAVRLASEGLEVRVAVGPAHPDRAALVSSLDAVPGVTVTESAGYATELASAGVAVLGAGSSLLEAACLRTPAIGVVVAENQRQLASACVDQGLVSRVLDADQRSLVDEISEAVADAAREPITRPGPGAVSGNGARLVAESIADVICPPVRLRPATIDDAEFLFALRTDAEVQRRSFHPAPTWDDHVVWFRSALDDATRRLFVIECESVPVGQVRLDAVGDHEVVSVAITEAARGRGVGRRALRAVNSIATHDLVAHIQPDNTPSIAMFSNVGFGVEAASGEEVVMRRRSGRDPEAGT